MADKKTGSFDDLRLSCSFKARLRAAGFSDNGEFINAIEKDGVGALITRLVIAINEADNSAYGLHRIYPEKLWMRATTVAVEVIIKLSFLGISFIKQIDEYIESLIEKDVKYSEIRFWKSLRIVLKYLPDRRFKRLDKDKLERFAQNYEFAARYLSEFANVTCGKITPFEDYIEIVCSECDYTYSVYFQDIISASCPICNAKVIAESKGFNLLDKCEFEDYGIDVEKLDKVTGDIDYLLICRLCNEPVTDIDLNYIDGTELEKLIEEQSCANCISKDFLRWVASKTNNSVEFDGEYVYFTDNETGQEIDLDIDDLSPRSIWKKIVFGRK